jgi:hypothetical protein
MKSRLGGGSRVLGCRGIFAAWLALVASASCGGDKGKHPIVEAAGAGLAGQGHGFAGDAGSESAGADSTHDDGSAGNGNDASGGAHASGGRSSEDGGATEHDDGGRGATSSGGGSHASGGTGARAGGPSAGDGALEAGATGNPTGGRPGTGGSDAGAPGAGGSATTGGQTSSGGQPSSGGTSEDAGASGAGGTGPEPCVTTGVCTDPHQTCEAGVCRDNPAPGRCFDSEQNGLETDVDCGGRLCSPCVNGHSCVEDADCASLRCRAHECAAAQPSYEADEDFETGDFSRFPYAFTNDPESTPSFTIESNADDCHAGSYCMRSSIEQDSNQTASVSLALSVREDTSVGFWVRTETEPGHHYFRFYIDGELQGELSGAHDWQELTFDVPATGPNGPNRVLTWEYERSDFVDPEHAPYNTVWIDDIDLPDWNTPPSVPWLLGPGNGARITASPTFRWRSVDPDFDPITYEVEYATDPTFATGAVTTGETLDLSWTPEPALAPGIYFWRARAKDDSDYRWTPWSEPSSVELVEQDDYAVRWRQSTGDEFQLNELVGLAAEPDHVRVPDTPYEKTVSTMPTSSSEASLGFEELPSAKAGAAATLALTLTARVNQYHYNSPYMDCVGNPCDNSAVVMLPLSTDSYDLWISHGQKNCSSATFTWDGSIPSIDAYVNSDGALDITVGHNSETCGNLSYLVSDEPVTATLSYPTVGEGTMTSVPIYFDDFGGAKNWEKLAYGGTAGTTVQLLDLDGELISDALVPGNSAGFAPGTVHLFWLDAEEYPSIRLRAHLVANSTLSYWEVYANDGYRWGFGNAGDTEGWEARDDGATPTATVADGVLTLASTAAGTNPRLEYRFAQSVAASRFQEAVLRARTSNDSADDTVTFYWESNYGLFDPVRSLSVVDFLFEPQDVAIDLTQATASPSQPWRGDISAIRFDPVDHFFDAAGDPSDGWVEVQEIWLR